MIIDIRNWMGIDSLSLALFLMAEVEESIPSCLQLYSNVTFACDDGVLDDTQAGVIVDNDMEKAILTKMMIMMVQMMTVYLKTFKLESLLTIIWRRQY